jgi:protein-L-isoaspartate(D-aspartate) O-methyltransferase
MRPGEQMVREQIAARGIKDARVLAAKCAVPRERFVSESLRQRAYEDSPLGIGQGQTISQPYIVALMAEAMAIGPTDRVLEVGTGCGYAAAVLACIAREVYTIERHAALASTARERLQALGIDNVHVRCGDGALGWPEHAPFASIAVAACADTMPVDLIAQLRVGGRLVIPIGPHADDQTLYRITRTADGHTSESLGPVRFVPLVAGAAS